MRYLCPVSRKAMAPCGDKYPGCYVTPDNLMFDCNKGILRTTKYTPAYIKETYEVLDKILHSNSAFAFTAGDLFEPDFKGDTLILTGYCDEETRLTKAYFEAKYFGARLLVDDTESKHWVAFKGTPLFCVEELLLYNYRYRPECLMFPSIKHYPDVEHYLGACVLAISDYYAKPLTSAEEQFMKVMCCTSLDHFLSRVDTMTVTDAKLLYARASLNGVDINNCSATTNEFITNNYLHELTSNCSDFAETPYTFDERMSVFGTNAVGVTQDAVAKAFDSLYANGVSEQFFVLNPLCKWSMPCDMYLDVERNCYNVPDHFHGQVDIYKYITKTYITGPTVFSDFVGKDEKAYVSYLLQKISAFKEYVYQRTL